MRSSSTSILGIAVAALVGLPATASARTRPYAGVSLEAAYDSNVLNTMGPDGVGRVVPRLGLVFDTHRWRVGAEYRLALHGYAQGKTDDSINHRGDLQATYAATRRLQLSGAATLIVADDPVLLDRLVVAIPQGGVIDLLTTAGGAWRATRRTTIDAAYLLRVTRFDQADDQSGLAFDGDEHRADAGVTWRATRRVDLRVRARGQVFVSYPGGDAFEQEALGASLGATWRITRLWRAGLDAGPMWMLDQTQSIYGRGELVRSGRRGRIALLAARELYGGTGASQALWSTSARLDAAWRFTRHVAGRARAGGYLSEEVDGTGEVSGLVARAELGWLSHQGTWRLDLYAEHRRQDTSGGIQFDDIDRTLAGVRLSVLTGVDFMALSEW
jgi:hypothetical protein